MSGWALWVGAGLLLAGLGFLLQAGLSDSAVRRWTHVQGTVGQASKAHLTDDGRQWWDVEVLYRADTGQQHRSWVRQIGSRVDERRGETVDVWYDPRRPDRAHAALAGTAAGASWVQYALGGALAVAGTAVLVWALR